MVNLKPEQIVDEWPGFTVYDAETGEPANIDDAVMQPIDNGFFALNENGDLVAVVWDDWREVESVIIPRQGNYLIQFANDGKFFRW